MRNETSSLREKLPQRGQRLYLLEYIFLQNLHIFMITNFLFSVFYQVTICYDFLYQRQHSKLLYGLKHWCARSA